MDIIPSDKIMSAISEVCASARVVQDKIHEIAVSTLDHIRTTGDFRGAVALLNALPKGQRVQGLAVWYREFSNGKITLRQDANKVWIGALKDRTDADFDMQGAEATSYADLTQEVTPKQMTLEAFVKSLERVSTDDKKLKDGTPKVQPAARALAAKMVSFYRGQQNTVQ